jgi:AcrR family transcriptional regulator
VSRKTPELRQRIVDRALELFNDYGLERVGMRELARDLQLSPGNLTYHFARKEDLILAIARRLSEANSQIYATHAQSPSFAQFLELFRRIFHNQYRFRCLPLNIVYLIEDYPSMAEQYRNTQTLRRSLLDEWLQQLQALGFLQADLAADQQQWLVSYCALVARFWLLEYWTGDRTRPVDEVIEYYLGQMASAFLPYASDVGRNELLPFLPGSESG